MKRFQLQIFLFFLLTNFGFSQNIEKEVFEYYSKVSNPVVINRPSGSHGIAVLHNILNEIVSDKLTSIYGQYSQEYDISANDHTYRGQNVFGVIEGKSKEMVLVTVPIDQKYQEVYDNSLSIALVKGLMKELSESKTKFTYVFLFADGSMYNESGFEYFLNYTGLDIDNVKFHIAIKSATIDPTIKNHILATYNHSGLEPFLPGASMTLLYDGSSIVNETTGKPLPNFQLYPMLESRSQEGIENMISLTYPIVKKVIDGIDGEKKALEVDENVLAAFN
ncbi:hypothetical protein [Marinigracilibium pacificum]|uniref:Zn-dependent exopeptidase M28 n=1 Tax=Marinigracilibium pacificum TaxID=2729599 RepID=A0A848IUZ3_9BACT|nr:hypothetical protein [Marinigracilibium pacificum]NMM47008.1 Zn-dependent exopeptidase M28 [Marinigracilibium pacificum]